jgi:glycosyltransferase involved in cell wall biosynthesis
MKITAVIPTKNRPNDLLLAVESVFNQSRLPDSLLIIDQSSTDKSFLIVNDFLDKNTSDIVHYIHDIRISGLVEAKSISVDIASGDIISFLEDDVILDPFYFFEIEKSFIKERNMLGCSGIIINMPFQSGFYQLVYKIFHLGIFSDPRSNFFGPNIRYDNELELCDVLSGGLSSWRKEVFSLVKFDTYNDLFMMEDIDFSTRVVATFGRRLFVNKNAKLRHFYSPVNREAIFPRHVKKISEYVIFYKKRKSVLNFFIFLWLIFGLFLDAIYKFLKYRNFKLITGYFTGLKKGINSRCFSIDKKI